MVKIIEPKVNVVDYGPKAVGENGEIMITPDEFVYGAAGITYKDIGALNELIGLRREDIDIRTKIKKSLIKSAGAGHASMATTPGFWVFLEGNCSKLVDSIFTGARFSSSLMPSGRRIPVTKEQIVVPNSIHRDKELESKYIEAIGNCIETYELLQERGVSKQEAAKIIPYGHRGGGFMFIPLETLIAYSKDFKNNQRAIPAEAREIVSQLEDFVHEHGMGVIYEARKAAPRTSSPNPGIFHFRKNLAQELIEDRGEILDNPIMLSETYLYSKERDERIEKFLADRIRFFEHQSDNNNTSELSRGVNLKDSSLILDKLEEIVNDFNNSVQIITASNSPWRVWGEVKRHRTLPQITESVYNAANRARLFAAECASIHDERWSQITSFPSGISEDGLNTRMWINAFNNAMNLYSTLIENGILESDAIAVVPRGLKMGIIKTWDLYNLTTGYMSLRLCKTAEPEMRRTTEQERDLILDSKNAPDTIKDLLGPKCSYVGFCPEGPYKRCCGQVAGYARYNEEIHNRIQEERELTISREIELN